MQHTIPVVQQLQQLHCCRCCCTTDKLSAIQSLTALRFCIKFSLNSTEFMSIMHSWTVFVRHIPGHMIVAHHAFAGSTASTSIPCCAKCRARFFWQQPLLKKQLASANDVISVSSRAWSANSTAGLAAASPSTCYSKQEAECRQRPKPVWPSAYKSKAGMCALMVATAGWQ